MPVRETGNVDRATTLYDLQLKIEAIHVEKVDSTLLNSRTNYDYTYWTHGNSIAFLMFIIFKN